MGRDRNRRASLAARIRWASAMVVLAALGTTALWIGVAGDAARMSGGLPLLPAAVNSVFGRLMFSAGGVVCLALLVWGLKLGPDRG